MSTMDYLEFKNHLEHSFTQKDKAEYYKKQGTAKVESQKRYEEKKKAAIAALNDYISTCNKQISDYKRKISVLEKAMNSPAGTNARSTEWRKMSNNKPSNLSTDLSAAKINLGIWEKELDDTIERKREITDNKYKEYDLDMVNGYYTVSHSNLSHASKAGMPTNIKKDQRTQIKKEIIRKIDAYLNSSKFTDIRSRGSFLTNEIKNAPGGGSIAQREMRKASLKGEASDKEAKEKAYNDLMTYIRKYSGSSAYANLFNQDEVELIYQLGSTHWGTAGPYAEKLKQSLSHDNLEHGWFTDLFKKRYEAKGSTAGMPTNLPRTATSGGYAGTKQLVYSDQLKKLNSNLVEYELKMNQAKASYEEYRKLYNDTKKNIANTEKALTEATKEAARTGFDPSKSSIAAPARRYASSNAILPQTTITGSTEGLKKTRYHVKKKK